MPNRSEIADAVLIVGAVVLLIGIGGLVYFIGPWLLHLLKWFVNLLILAIKFATPALSVILAAAISSLVAVLSFFGLVLIFMEGVRLLGRRLFKIITELRDVKLEVRAAGKDAAFVAVLAAMSALVLYFATNDFLGEFNKFSTIRILAASSVAFCIAKLFLLFPARAAKAIGIFALVAILVGTALILIRRFDLLTDATTGFHGVRELLVHAQPVRLSVLATITIFAALSLLYPFTLREWKRMLNSGGASHPRGNSTVTG